MQLNVVGLLGRVREFLSSEWPGGEIGQSLANQLTGFIQPLVGFLIALASLLTYFIYRALKRWRAERNLRAAQAEAPGLITVLVLAPSGFGLGLSGSQRADRDAFHAGLVEGLTEGMRGFAPHANMRAFRYPAFSGWPARREAQELSAKKLRQLRKRAVRLGTDLIVASDKRSAERASAIILSRNGEDSCAFGMTLSEAPGDISSYLAQAIAFYAVGTAAPDAPPFHTWKSVDRDRLMEQLAPLILNPPTDKPSNWDAMLAAFSACGEAALQRDFMSKTTLEALVSVRGVAFETAPEGWMRSRAALELGEALHELGVTHLTNKEDLDVVNYGKEGFSPRAAYLFTRSVLQFRRFDLAPDLLDRLRAGNSFWHYVAQTSVLSAWASHLSGEILKSVVFDGLSVARQAIAMQDRNAEDMPRFWAMFLGDFFSLQMRFAMFIDPGERASGNKQAEQLEVIRQGSINARAALDSAIAPAALAQILRTELDILHLLNLRQSGREEREVAEERVVLAKQFVALVREDRNSYLAALARATLGNALAEMATLYAPIRVGWLREAVEHFRRAEELFGGDSDAALARIDGSKARIRLLIARWQQAASADRVRRAKEAEEGLRQVVIMLEEQNKLESIPHQWRGVASQQLARAWAALAELYLSAGHASEAAIAFERAAQAEIAAADISRSLGDVFFASRAESNAAGYTAQAGALLEAEANPSVN